MKILHTANWHLGKQLYCHDHSEDHRLLFAWMIKLVKQENIAAAQELRKNIDDESFTEYIDQWIAEMQSDFINEEYKAVMETVGPNREFSDHFDGRTLNPGHAIEDSFLSLKKSISCSSKR